MTYEKFKDLSTALEEEDGWSTCIELREANGKLWERAMGRPGGPETRFGRFQWDILMCLIITS